MTGFSRGQNVSPHRGLYKLGPPPTSIKCFNYSRVHNAQAQPSWFALAVAYIPLQVTKSLSIVSLHLIWTGYSQSWLYMGLKQPRLDYTRVYYGLVQFIPRVYYGMRGYELA